jgi:hypothetical protein
MKTSERRKERIWVDADNVKADLPEKSKMGARIEWLGEGVWYQKGRMHNSIDGRVVGLSQPRLIRDLALKHIPVR